MAFERIGILSIGEMGYHWARILSSRGVEVLTYAEDRSETTRSRAENIGVKCLPSMDRLVQDADLIVSIVVPFAANRVASKVAEETAKSGRQDLLYLRPSGRAPAAIRLLRFVREGARAKSLASIRFQSHLCRLDQRPSRAFCRALDGRKELWTIGRDSRTVRRELSGFAGQSQIQHHCVARPCG